VGRLRAAPTGRDAESKVRIRARGVHHIERKIASSTFAMEKIAT
jgi:hypothetical protein